MEFEESTGDVRNDAELLSNVEGLEWMGDLLERDDVDWQAVQEVHNQWSESDSGVGGPGMQLVSLAMAVALSLTPGGQGVAGALMTTSTGQATAFGAWATSLGIKEGLTAAIAAGFNSLVLQAGTQIIGNGGDIGAALKALASMDTVRSLATTMLTAGLTQGALDRFAKSTLAGRIDGLAKELTKGAISAGINTGVGTAINGGRLDENLIANLRSSAVSVLGAEAAHDIGEAYKNNKLDYVAHKIAHAALGGAMAAANGDDIASEAVGGAVGEITGEVLMRQIKEAMVNRQDFS
ncbi:DUF637 domain-containing protein [Pseudodesulfovibrio sp.]|uniref:DUF637 domain-containing protein n=1 Tax=unclassified Pseudodesulfovibrio TaxID=2661612 RepID=UPI003AFFA10F